jgi:hypothetical protein
MNCYICILKPLKRTLRLSSQPKPKAEQRTLFKHENAQFFPSLGKILACLDPDSQSVSGFTDSFESGTFYLRKMM